MIHPDDNQFSLDTLSQPGGVIPVQTPNLSSVMDKLQEAGLLGLSPDKRRSAIRSLSAEQVKDLQTTLVEAGFEDVGAIDGIAGRKTFQGIEQALAKNTLQEIFSENDASDAETVRRIQESLNTLGYESGRVDGVFGTKTSAAIGHYLNEEGISTSPLPENVRGKLQEFNVALDPAKTVGVTLPLPKTVDINGDPALMEVLGAYEQTEEDVKLLQTFLKEQGFDVGAVDGDFGPRTTREFVSFLEQNPGYHSAIGPNLLLETEIYAADHGVSDSLRLSLNLRDLSQLPTPSDEIRYQAYKDYFSENGKPEELARGIKIAAESTGRPMEELFVVMKQESIDFGNYNPARGNSSANRTPNNYGQFTDGTKRHMDERYGDEARRELGREGIHYDPNEDWRDNPLIAPYMVAKYLEETGSYPAYVLPAIRGREDSNAIVASHYPAEARSNRHIFFEGKNALSFAEAAEKISETLHDDYRAEQEIVRLAQLKALKDDILKGREDFGPIHQDIVDPTNTGISGQSVAGLVGDQTNPERAVTALNMKASFARASDLIQIADLTPDGKGPRPSGWTPSNDFV